MDPDGLSTEDRAAYLRTACYAAGRCQRDLCCPLLPTCTVDLEDLLKDLFDA
jgi:hypothetical protein